MTGEQQLAAIKARLVDALAETEALDEWVNAKIKATTYTQSLPWFEVGRLGGRIAEAVSTCDFIEEEFGTVEAWR